ncbi:hypothetical protein ACH5RR_021922 [Cinchona calisaya]|uniref:Nuclear pore complex protein n=1 Tax=Cinchona calisaya TaxID=153742 RepID=A0ABD2Z9M4_9GENT
MATTANASENQSLVHVKTLDASLWWDSFRHLLTELENVSVSSDLPPPLEKKLKENHAWFLDTVTMFKPPDQKSREALDSKQLKIGSHELNIQTHLKDTALKISSLLSLNEVQSYILVERSVEHNSLASDSMLDELLHLVMVQYYIERQCLLKCTRQILTHALFVGSRSKEVHAVWQEAQKLISDGLEDRLLSILEGLLLSNYPEHVDVDLYTLWAEETLIEDNLVLDILFLAYYECFSTCSGKQWKKLLLLYEGAISGSFNLAKLAISAEAARLIYYAKVQLLLILIETLDLENLLQMIHDEIPFRQGSVAFSLVDIQEMDAIVSGIDPSQTREAGPLILSWAVFLCLICSLPEKEDNYVLMEMDHVNYVRQAIEAASMNYFHEILESNIWKELDGPTAGYRSVLRTFISSFVASYEISLQLEDNNLRLILDILCKIYQGEESLCNQFWDRESFVDGPIRCLLCNLEGEFPVRVLEFVRLLSALSEGSWPAECVYNFLDKSVGLSSLFEISSDSLVDGTSKTVITHLPLHVPNIEGLIIPRGTRGQVIRMIDRNTALVRWEYAQSGVVVLLFRIAQELFIESSEEVLVTLDLLSRLVTFSLTVCNALMLTGKSSCESTSMEGQQEEYGCLDVVEMVCNLVKNLHPTCNGAAVMSMGVSILTKMLKCSPHPVATMTMKANIFDVASRMNPFHVLSNGLTSESWLLSGKLAKMLLIDCERNDCSLTLSVLDFTIQLVESGFENDVVLALVIFSLQYVLVNHEIWTYKVKHARWKVTLKVLDVVKKCILSISSSKQLGVVIQDILLSDSSIHNALFQIVCTTKQGLEKLYLSRLYELIDIEGLQLAISSGLDILFDMLSLLSKDPVNLSTFHQAILSPMTKPIPVVVAAISLMSSFQTCKIQVSAARLLSLLFVTGNSSSSFAFGNACLGLDNKQICEFRGSINRILSKQSVWNEELIIATFRLLTSAACYQPAFLAAMITSKENSTLCDAPSEKYPNKADCWLESKGKTFVDAILHYLRKSDDFMKCKPNVLSNVLNFLKAVWQAAPQFTNFLEQLKNSENFWKHISDSVMLISHKPDDPSQNLTRVELRNLVDKYYCQSDLLEIISYEIFMHKKLLHVELVLKETSELSKDQVEKVDRSRLAKDGSICGLKDLLSTWFKSSLLGDLIKSYAWCTYNCEMHLQAMVSASLFSVHAMLKLKGGDMGSLSISLIEKILALSEKLINLPAFSELLTRYTQYGYSQGKDLQHLILSDLFYHLQGELEGRQIDDRSFKELLQYLLQSQFLQTYLCKGHADLQSHIKDVNLYDLSRLQSDIGLELWDLLPEWKASKSVAEKMLHCLDDINEMVLLMSSKLSALKALVAMLSLYGDDSSDNGGTISGMIPEQLTLTCINYTCQSLDATIEFLAPDLDVSQDVLDILVAQAELLLHLIKSIGENLSLRFCVLILKASGQGLKVLSGFRSSDTGVKETIKLLLMLVLFSVNLSWMKTHLAAGIATDSVVGTAEASTLILGLLPILCHCTQFADHYKLALTAIDMILRGFSAPATWIPIVEKHLQLHYIVLKLRDESSVATVTVILQFLLTLSRVREGAMMLVNAGIFASLRGLFSKLSDDQQFSIIHSEGSLLNAYDKTEKPKHIWGLSLAVITSIIHSLGDSSLSTGIVDYVMANLLVEKAFLISYYLSAPDFPSDDHDKKRARSLKRHTTLSTLRETEQTLVLICVLARERNSWNKAMKEMDSQLREKSIHLLAFISRGNQRLGELPKRVAPLLCHPVLKEEFEWCKKPSFINSRNGWFVLSPLGCRLDPKFSCISSRTTSLVSKDQLDDNAYPAPQTHFSDVTAIQIYKITFLLLNFLCIQAEGATKRAEEVGFVDLAHFPELPMPDILHGLQDQGIIIVTELCEANKSKLVTPAIQDICQLLLQISVMSLHLELCVIQICGMRPVLGRAEDFLKEFRLLIRATEGQAFLKETLKSLKQIVSFVYPELQAEALI